MRIVHFNAGGPEFHGREYQYDAHHAHMIDELRRRGHEVLHINPAATLGRYGSREEYGDITVSAVREFQAQGGCDMFFATAVDHSFSSEIARTISEMGIPAVNLNMDDLSHPYRVKEVTAGFDLVWTTEPSAVEIIRGYGARMLVHMPFAANPNVFYPVVTADFERAIAFIGACYGARSRAIARLAQADVPVRVFGRSPMEIYGPESKSFPALRALFSFRDGWHRAAKSISFPAGRACVRGAVMRTFQNAFLDLPEKHPAKGNIKYRAGPSFEDWSKMMGGMAMSLGSMELASTFVLKKPLQFIRLREFEAAMAGAAHLTSPSEELMEYFEPDKEMIFYENFDDMIDKARFWLGSDQDTARMALRKAARNRSLGEHTWAHRFQKLFDLLGVKAKV